MDDELLHQLLTDGPPFRCSKCQRGTWDTAASGQRCNMTQPSGNRCDGQFEPAEED